VKPEVPQGVRPPQSPVAFNWSPWVVPRDCPASSAQYGGGVSPCSAFVAPAGHRWKLTERTIPGLLSERRQAQGHAAVLEISAAEFADVLAGQASRNPVAPRPVSPGDIDLAESGPRDSTKDDHRAPPGVVALASPAPIPIGWERNAAELEDNVPVLVPRLNGYRRVQELPRPHSDAAGPLAVSRATFRRNRPRGDSRRRTPCACDPERPWPRPGCSRG
jgi:hypothetical protein